MLHDRDHLESLKYRQLQRIAKQYDGVKANLPRKLLIEELLHLSSDECGKKNQCDDSPNRKSRNYKNQVSFTAVSPDKYVTSTNAKITNRIKTPRSHDSRFQKGDILLDRSFSDSPLHDTSAKSTIEEQASKQPTYTRPVSQRTPMKKSASKLLVQRDSARITRRAIPASTRQSSGQQSQSSRKRIRTDTESAIPRVISKPVPDFAKLHARQFSAMQSIDCFVSRRKEALVNSAKKVASTNSPCKAVPNDAKTNSQLHAQAYKFNHTEANVENVNLDFGSKQSEDNSNATNCRVIQFSGSAVSDITNTVDQVNRAQLKKKPTYRPHVGKLKPFEPILNWRPTGRPKSIILQNEGRPSTKNGRQSRIKGVRLNRRAELLMARRGL